MSSRNEDGIPFEIAQDLHGLRLLELPPSLLELVRSGDSALLAFKSASKPIDGGAQDAAHAVLCTQSQTFQVRQVQSSNSVFVLEPSEQSVTSESNDVAGTSLRAIAKCPNMLELVPTTPEAVAFLKHGLPVYMGDPSDSHSSTNAMGPDGRKSKSEVLEDAPFSADEFNEAWTKVCAFEAGDVAWIPTATLLIKVWGGVATAATIRGLDFDERFPIGALTSTADEDGFPVPLVEAILARVSIIDRESMDQYATVDRSKCVFWVGSTFLDSMGGEVATSKFLEQWRDKLPEDWRGDATLAALKGSFRHTTNTTIVYSETPQDEKPKASDGSKASNGRQKPNWHERFKNTKR